MEQTEKKGVSGLSIAGFVLSFFIAPVGLILSIVSIAKKDGKAKGFSIAGIIISVLNILIALIVFLVLAGTMLPQLNKYEEKTRVSQDMQFADSIKEAITVSFMEKGSQADFTDDYVDIETIPEGEFRDEIEEILGMKIEDLTGNIKSHHSKDAQILYKLTGESGASVIFTTTDATGKKKDNEENYIKVGR